MFIVSQTFVVHFDTVDKGCFQNERFHSIRALTLNCKQVVGLKDNCKS